MEWLQTLLDNSTAPALTAFLLGLLTAVSPCPLATNIAAIGFIGKDIENRRRIFLNGLLYTLGRVIAYTLLGIVLILILKEGSSLFGIQKFIGKYGELVLGPALLLIGLFILFGGKLKLPSFGFKGNGEGLARKGGCGAFLLGMLFDQRSFLLRHADSHVGNNCRRLSAARPFCRSYRIARFDSSLDIGVQCTAYRQFLWQNAECTEMAE